jgi:hypothetical protein
MGGGGGGGRDLTPEELRQFEENARKIFRKDTQPEKRNVFISFASEDIQDVNLLRGQAKSKSSDLDFIDHSVKDPIDSKRADYIKQKIREKIKRASVTVCYVSKSTAQSKWVDWEIRESLKLGKGVIAMHEGNSPPKTLPKAITEHGIKPMAWSQKTITKAIEKSAQDRE